MTEKPTGTAPTIKVEVACAFPDRQYLIALQAPVGCTARQAVALAKLDALATELDLATAPLGIFGNALKDPDGHTLQEGDRVEVYRALLLDPKEMRRQRAERAKRRKGAEAGSVPARQEPDASAEPV